MSMQVTYNFLIFRIRFPGFKLRVVCFNPNLQDLEGCEATPIDQLFSSSGRKRRSAPIGNTQHISRTFDKLKSEKLMEQFIRDVSGSKEQVNYS